MKTSTNIAVRILALFIGVTGVTIPSLGQHGGSQGHHEMQHGFILGADDNFASHLVAKGHHSRQTEITGQLIIDDQQEMKTYQVRKQVSAGSTYFLFQAQSLDLPTLSAGQTLVGHIVESKMGDYNPANRIVRSARFQVRQVLLNIPNPFFEEKKLHCCETGAKPCNWKC